VPVFLLDLNVLLPIFWPPHENHGRAQEWLAHDAASGGATCPFSQAAFIRMISNPRFTREAVAPMQAERTLHVSLNHSSQQFWPDELRVRDAIAPLRASIVGHRQITDAYLLGLAIFRKGKLATFDHAIASLVPAGVATNSVLELL
jgi:toxin-antitoxin system PIN domain toxin